jgi:hypothetical protein
MDLYGLQFRLSSAPRTCDFSFVAFVYKLLLLPDIDLLAARK